VSIDHRMYYKIHWRNPSKVISQIYGSGQTPFTVNRFHIVFDALSSDDLFKFQYSHIATRRLLEIFRENQFTGLGICKELIVEMSGEFKDLYISEPLPSYFLLAVKGTPGGDDIGITADYDLVISARVLNELNGVNMSDVDIEEF
jgi:hypothetical protein